MSSTSNTTVVPSRDGFPDWMTTDADRGGSQIVFDPSALVGRVTGLQLERFLIKFPRLFFIGNGDGDECDFLNHFVFPWLGRFEFVNHDFVAVRILHHGHVADRSFESFRCETHVCFL